LSNNGIAAYNQFQEVYKLDVVQRQSGNSKKQQDFRDILLRLRDGESTLADWKMLITRIEDKLNKTECDEFFNVTFILIKWADVNEVNINQLKSLNVSIAKIHAIHTGVMKLKKLILM
jgi:hypothetical protein